MPLLFVVTSTFTKTNFTTKTIEILQQWGLGDGNRPLIIAGPCSAETPEQMLETATGISAGGIGVFRAGLWKPRTRPGAFEGVGNKGIGMMQQVQSVAGMKVATEVANAAHAEAALQAGFDVEIGRAHV